ncbi:hypothetical protein SODALDRAFT_364121 [Sodiomyces alkalinus F11]|uniref:Uncharacterized protein n=1 Tax=Sodiomyces alkalinus (strain CBS 110278 / VKM F-3762 / F11) TaxID=1314773 RepID=A0A3N2PJD2_SODAK|nr:hypothetical protein SODALDRAFT_364121 [Sodiomyces alkalinus F11]ROT34625.1 hypothetical protein SODALDRAFT_364121 [Sodiomyces alkalinus F11]
MASWAESSTDLVVLLHVTSQAWPQLPASIIFRDEGPWEPAAATECGQRFAAEKKDDFNAYQRFASDMRLDPSRGAAPSYHILFVNQRTWHTLVQASTALGRT